MINVIVPTTIVPPPITDVEISYIDLLKIPIMSWFQIKFDLIRTRRIHPLRAQPIPRVHFIHMLTYKIYLMMRKII